MAHIVSPHKVWEIEALLKDEGADKGNLINYKIWADNAQIAQAYLRKHLRSVGVIEIEIIKVGPVQNPSVGYTDTLNCKINDPEKYGAGHPEIFSDGGAAWT